MSFVKGKFYRCISGTGSSLTTGKVYECLGYNDTGIRGGDFQVMHDTSSSPLDFEIRYGERFDPTPVPPPNAIPPSPVAAHVATMQAQAIGALAKAAPPANKSGCAPFCKCGQTASKRSFNTFDYWYCTVCKKEVGGKAEEPKPGLSADIATTLSDALSMDSFQMSIAQAIYGNFSTPPPNVPPSTGIQQQALPPGIVALKGEKIICETCGAEHGYLGADLAGSRNLFTRSYEVWTAYLTDPCCPMPMVSKLIGSSRLFNVKGRGWV